MERGGRASKLGDTYERLWAVRHALLVVEGQSQSLLWEPLGEDENGIDLWIETTDGRRIGHQLKRQNRSKEYWSIADLREEGVLQHARGQLERRTDTEYRFVSSCGVRYLRDLAEQSHRADDDPDVFYRDLVCKNKKREKGFEELMLAWDLDPEATADVTRAFRLLQRMEFLVQERSKWERKQVEFAAGLVMDGTPATAVAAIGDLLDANLGRTLHADELRRRLEKRGFPFRNLAGDPALPAAIKQLQDRFDAAIADNLIADVPIPRPETVELTTYITGSHPPRLIFVHGQAGSGKSVVVQQVFKALDAAGVPCLPIQLHVRRPEGTPRSFAQSKLGLPASPALSLRGLAGSRHAVLLLDQLDALRLTSIHSSQAWEACAAIIDEAIADPCTTVIVACRTFDLENDPNIAAWKRRLQGQPSNLAVELKIGDLPEHAVADLLDQHATKFASLPDRQRKLLRQPASLALWWNLATAGRAPSQFTNATQLMREVLKLRRIEASRDHDVSVSELNYVITQLVNFMESQGRLDAPESLVPDHNRAVNALCSLGLVKRDDAKLTFAHQGYFDHLVAEQVLARALRGDDDPAQWLKSNQSLFRRDQLRQLLTLLRDADPTLHEKLLRTILLDSGVRFHLKHLVLGLLSQSAPPLDHEVRLVAELAENPTWWEHIQAAVLWSKIPWFDALHRAGHLARWLSTWTDEKAAQMLLSSLRPIASHRGEQVDELLAPYWSAGGPWPSRLEAVFLIDPSDDSPGMSVYRLERVRAGEWRFDDVYLDRIAERRPIQLVPVLAAVIEAWINRIRHYMRGPEGAKAPRWQLRDDVLDPKVLAVVRCNSHGACRTFSDALRLISTLHRLANRGNRTVEDFAKRDWSLGFALVAACDFVERLLVASIEGLALQDPDQVATLLHTCPARKMRGLERAIARGLACGDHGLADVALTWLYARPSRFRLGDGTHESYWEPARALIVRFAPHCSETVFRCLEQAILTYHDHWERRSVELQLDNLRKNRVGRNDWGRAQNVLLAALPVARMSDRARLVASAWLVKFGDSAKEQRTCGVPTVGRVVSPIPPDKLMFVSDGEWLRIISGKWPEHEARRWREHSSGMVGEASVRHFTEALGSTSKRAPRRFAALALRIPRNSDPRYFASILNALGESHKNPSLEPVRTEELEAIIAHIGECNDAAYAMTVCRLVDSRPEARWSDDMVHRILSYVDHADPAPGVFAVLTRIGPDSESKQDVGQSALNCVRGCVAKALTRLLWVRPDASGRIVPAVERLLADPHPSVRYEALGASLATMEHDKELAVRIAIAACDHEDDRVLESHWLSRLILLARATHLNQFAPIIERMAKSTVDAVAESGAAWACACWLDTRRFADLVRECRTGSKAQRLGVTIAASEYLADKSAIDASVRILLGMFNDSERDVRSRAASVFRQREIFSISSTVELASGFVKSAAFLDVPDNMLHPLTEYSGKLASYSQVILNAADVMSGPFAEQTRDIRERNAFAGNELSTLLIRIYEIAYGSGDNALQEQCLDRWDRMLQGRVGMTEEHLRQLDD